MNRLETFAPRPALAYVLLVIATMVWGSGLVIGRGVAEAIPPVGLAFWRVSVAVAILAPLALPNIAAVAPLIRRHWRFIVFLAMVQIWPQAIMLIALHFTTAINATLINAGQPAITAILMVALYRDRVNAGQAVGIALALIGILVMVTRGDPQVIASLGFNRGDAIVVGCVILWSIYAIKLPAVPRELGLATTLFLINLAGLVTIFPFYIAESLFWRTVSVNALTLTTIVYTGAIISAASILVWNLSIRAVGPQRTSIFLNLNPVFATLFAVVFLGERLHPYHIAGAVLVIGGITLMIRMARAARPATTHASTEAEA